MTTFKHIRTHLLSSTIVIISSPFPISAGSVAQHLRVGGTATRARMYSVTHPRNPLRPPLAGRQATSQLWPLVGSFVAQRACNCFGELRTATHSHCRVWCGVVLSSSLPILLYYIILAHPVCVTQGILVCGSIPPLILGISWYFGEGTYVSEVV
jgi:hypothetical protein